MFKDYKVVAVTPAGRERYLEILLPYILQNRSIIDEYHLWINTTNKSDINYINNLGKQFPDFIKLVSLDIEPCANKTIRFFFRSCIDKNTIYIRIDDDICFIDKNAIENLLEFRINNKKYFIVYANIINNSICSFINQIKGKIDLSEGYLTYNAFCNNGWKSGKFAAIIHSQFIENYNKGKLDTYQYNSWILSDFERVSVNFITWFGKDFAEFNGVVDGEDEEQWLSVDKPKSINRYNCICGTAIVSHFSYYVQREYLESKTDILQKYKLMSQEVLSTLDFIKKITNNQNKKFMEELNKNSLNQLSLPVIQSLEISEKRPFWSVMIPTYNCANYLVETLKSVLEQDPGSDQMQIEVVDDCSTKDDPEAIVREMGQGRVSFFRQPQNVGATANFNTCIQRAKGEWVHILHGDDTVLPGFYSRLRKGIEQDTTVGAAFSRYLHIDESGNWRLLSYLERETPGTLHNFWQTLAVVNRVMTPCIVVKRSVYETLGGFHTELIHAADWEMWRRIVVHYPIWFEPLPLACYREHSFSDSSRLTRTGSNLLDIRKSIDIVESYLPRPIGTELSNLSREVYAGQALDTAKRMLNKGDIYAAVNQIREALKCYNSPKILNAFASLLTNSEDLMRLSAHFFVNFDSNQLLSENSDHNQTETQVQCESRDINLIAFPDWEAQEELLYEDLTKLFRSILSSPQREQISLLVENNTIPDEDANLIISDVIFNLLQEDNLCIEEEPAVCLLSNLNEKQWQFVLHQVHALILLNHQNQKAIAETGADKIVSLHLSELVNHLNYPYTPSIGNILAKIQTLPSNWHTGGALPISVLEAIAKHVKFRKISCSIETGSGASTLLLSHISQDHKVFSYDCGSNGLTIVRSSSLLNTSNVEFIEGPTQKTLPQYKFDNKIQLALIDGPHAYPFPDLEYYFIYPHLEENALLILDDIHIPNIHNLFIFMAEDEMFNLIEIVGTTAFFRRTDKPVFSPVEDNWYSQNFNKHRFPIKG